jgi:hypothetical protein
VRLCRIRHLCDGIRKCLPGLLHAAIPKGRRRARSGIRGCRPERVGSQRLTEQRDRPRQISLPQRGEPPRVAHGREQRLHPRRVGEETEADESQASGAVARRPVELARELPQLGARLILVPLCVQGTREQMARQRVGRLEVDGSAESVGGFLGSVEQLVVHEPFEQGRLGLRRVEPMRLDKLREGVRGSAAVQVGQPERDAHPGRKRRRRPRDVRRGGTFGALNPASHCARDGSMRSSAAARRGPSSPNAPSSATVRPLQRDRRLLDASPGEHSTRAFGAPARGPERHDASRTGHPGAYRIVHPDPPV